MPISLPDGQQSFYAPHYADLLAERLNETDDMNWTYVAQHCPTGEGLSRVDIFDENNVLVGRWRSL